MSTDVSPWARYWKDQTIFDDAILARNTRVFVRASERIMTYSAADRVLDVGCGSGDLIGTLAPRVREVCGLDTSRRYVESCRERFKAFENVTIEQIGARYTDFSMLGDREFDKIVCLSVIQYYREKDDLRSLIREVQRIAAPGARFLIGDILSGTSLVQDISSLLRSAVRDGEPIEVFRFLWRVRFSEYGKLRREIGLLSFSQDELLDMANDLEVKAEIIDGLTVNRNRSNLLICF